MLAFAWESTKLTNQWEADAFGLLRSALELSNKGPASN